MAEFLGVSAKKKSDAWTYFLEHTFLTLNLHFWVLFVKIRNYYKILMKMDPKKIKIDPL